MKYTGVLKPPLVDYSTGRMIAQIELNEDFKEGYEALKDCKKISVEIKKYKAKRSLDANAYYWVLLTRFAEKIGLSNAEAHNMLLCGYGQPMIIDGECVYTEIVDTEEAERKIKESDVYHLRPTSSIRVDEHGVAYRSYLMLKGSKEYNTEEMSRLISGLVEQCIEVGIPKSDIVSPEETRILYERFGINID